MQDKKLALWQKQLARAKLALHQLGPMRPGSLSQQFKRPGRTSGPYWKISYTHHMRSYTRYVRPEEVPELKAMIANFKRFRILVDRCVDLSIQIADLKFQRQRESEPTT
jgi:hypothetical protein